MTLAVLLAALVSFGGEPLSLEFGDETDGFGIRSITVAGERFVNPPATGCDFWQLEVRRTLPDGSVEKLAVDNRYPCAERRQAVKDGLIAFKWTGIDLPDDPGAMDVIAAVSSAEDGRAFDWKLKITNRSRIWTLAITRYPYLRGIIPDREGDAMLPSQLLGMRLHRGFACGKGDSDFPAREWNFPSWYSQSFGFFRGGKGLYCWAMDGEGRTKRIRYLPGCTMFFETPVVNAGVNGKAAGGPGYTVRTSAIRGGWWQAAAVYRDWALKQKWCAKGPIASRADFPKRLYSTGGLMVINGGGSINQSDELRGRWPKAGIGYDWSQYNYNKFDTFYPHMLPALPNVPRANDHNTALGITAFHYTNGRLWDTTNESYRTAAPYATKKENGDVYIEEYGPGHRFAVMCPFTGFYRTEFPRIELEIVDALHANALYIDQTCCSHPKWCFDPSHGHPVGGGSYWMEGTRGFLQTIHDQTAPRDIPLMSEGAGEVWIGCMDAYQLASELHPDDLPFYTAVYGGYAVYVGSQVKNTDDFPAFFASQARQLLWGCMLETGWYCNWPQTEKNPRIADAWAKLCETRIANPRVFIESRLDGELVLDKPQEEVAFRWGTRYGSAEVQKNTVYEARFPAVYGMKYVHAATGKHAVALVNLTDSVREVSFTVPFGKKTVLKPWSVAVFEE